MKPLAVLALMGLSFEALCAISTTYFAPLDVNALHRLEVAAEKKGEAPRFAVPHKISVKADLMGASLTDGQYVWTHRVTAPNAVSLNFAFGNFHLPEGAKLEIYSADRTQFIRAFTSEDNNLHRELWTPVILSDDVLIELTVPAESLNQVELELTQVGQGFRKFGDRTQKSGDCNVDVACSDSQGWEKEVNAVAVISTGGSTFCTGFMVNNTSNDKTPLFMTANHCRINSSNAASLVTYWNYQTSACGGARDGKLSDFNTGSVFLASGARSDFTLVKLLKSPRPEYRVNYAGWDASGNVGNPSTAIHHPNVDEKSISFDHDPSRLTSYGDEDTPGDSTHVMVHDWDVGTTEPGSSGSPLFDDKHRVIGQLHGGGAACGNDLPDWYGRFYTSWKGDGSKTGSLKPHLDPGKTGHLATDTI